MVKHYWLGVHKGVALCRSEKKALETEQRKTSVEGVASGATVGGADGSGAYPGGWTSASLDEQKRQNFGGGTRG
jgi:hypothetical protein